MTIMIFETGIRSMTLKVIRRVKEERSFCIQHISQCFLKSEIFLERFPAKLQADINWFFFRNALV